MPARLVVVLTTALLAAACQRTTAENAPQAPAPVAPAAETAEKAWSEAAKAAPPSQDDAMRRQHEFMLKSMNQQPAP
ncbi:MAG: hypothetical protein AB1938_07635 [Myxococcota bacterium]